MEPSQFLSSLLAIVLIDIVLAGDNAIVIALAARQLPAHLQRRAIAWRATRTASPSKAPACRCAA